MKNLNNEMLIKLFKVYEKFNFEKYGDKMFFLYIKEKFFVDFGKPSLYKKFKIYYMNYKEKGTLPEKKKPSIERRGRKRKVDLSSPEWKVDYDVFDKEDMVFVIEMFREIFDRNGVDFTIQDAIKLLNQKKGKSRKRSQLILCFLFKKSTFYDFVKRSYKMTFKKSQIQKEMEIIKKAMEDTKFRFGRERLSFYILKKHGIALNYRTIGRRMKKLGLKCVIRQKSKRKESKNTNVKFPDLMKRDFDGLKQETFSTDVTYISAPKDVKENHVFLSAVLHNKTKKIVGWSLSRTNNVELVLDSLTSINFSKIHDFVIHSDHGSQYSSQEYLETIKNLNGKISMSRVGNSLDNREIEYFFSILKTELIYNISTKDMSFVELKSQINNFIEWYNTERFQKKLNFKTPQESWSALYR
ncbi:IS3 family transposase [Mycoplasma sp. Ms02]|uniref:IS3 family transposase n=1 Tax=Mycoplasma sp. Ms02 TaxID=353851 RepID=UPI001C8ABADD|nr:IS3 family transposase [Mycoplasma sp. Ms02]QZE12376.1 IS3 family transposase [Mycoplasma sp. Ms02]